MKAIVLQEPKHFEQVEIEEAAAPGAGEALAQDKLFETLYEGHDGPVTAFDVLFGHRETTADGNVFMIHKGEFTYSTLDSAFYDAGFKVRVGGRSGTCSLYLVAFKQKKAEEEIKKIALQFLPKGFK